MLKAGRIVQTLTATAENARIGESAFIRLKNDTIMFAYTRFGGSGDDHDQSRLCAIFSKDEGETWTEPVEMFDDDHESRNNMSPTLLRCPDGRLGVCYLRKSITEDNCVACMPVFRASEDEGGHWSEMIFCAREPGYYCGTNAASAVLSSGRIVTPISYMGPPISRYTGEPGRIIFLCSDDSGKSWYRHPAEISSPYRDQAGLMEPGILELPDGRLWCYMRTMYGYQYQSFSSDGGGTWSIPKPNLFLSSPDSPMRVANTGRYTVAVLNPVGRALFSGGALPWGGGRRTPLLAALSADGGISLCGEADTFSWPALREYADHCVLLEDSSECQYCYPAVIGTRDGFLVSYYYGSGAHILRDTKILKVNNTEIGTLFAQSK